MQIKGQNNDILLEYVACGDGRGVDRGDSLEDRGVAEVENMIVFLDIINDYNNEEGKNK